jgi:hypothetical protein
MGNKNTTHLSAEFIYLKVSPGVAGALSLT